ncbi:hypothetical protein BDR04DRAFT_65336 [Suillus decipiens]|nr:hypothetical protein BDR04DRAFT_65336 [Suillus decipiens]
MLNPKVPSLPVLTFYFGSKSYPLKGSDYVLEVQGTCVTSFTGGIDINSPAAHCGLLVIYSSTVATLFTTLAGTLLGSPKLHEVPAQSRTIAMLVFIPQGGICMSSPRSEILDYECLGVIVCYCDAPL